jgi:hypothetical protein
MQREINSSLPSSCAVCRNLNYNLFESGHSYSRELDGINPTRYLTLEFQDLRASAEKGCTTCDIINRGTCLFWGDYPEKLDASSDDSDASSEDDDETYRLCLERRPGKSLTAFRFLYEPRATGIQMRIEFFTENGI